MVESQANIALFGGSFDPVHFGHLRLAEEVCEKLTVDRFDFLPCHVPPHKQGLRCSPEHRLSMLRLALNGLPHFGVDSRELMRDTPSYTFDSLYEMRQELGLQRSINFVLGWDSWISLTSWHRWKELFELTNFVVVKRPGSQEQPNAELARILDEHEIHADQLLRHSAGKVVMVNTTPWAISSTEVRQFLANEQSVDGLIPESVIDYIHTHRLYLSDSEILS